MPYFSICIPNYNYARYISQTIRSVLAQSFEDFEIVVVDNASTDDSVAAVEAVGDPRIRLFRNRYNVGFAANLQRATAQARGRFLLLLSADDLMAPGALGRYREILEAQGDAADTTVICSAADVVDENGRILRVLYKPYGDPIPSEMSVEQAERTRWGAVEKSRGHDVLRECLRRCKAGAVFCATMYPRRLWEAVEGYDTAVHIAPDAAFLHKLLAMDPSFLWVHERLFSYRVHSSNQGAQVSRLTALKVQVDVYMRTVNYPQAVLDQLSITRSEVIRGFLEQLCLNVSVAQLARGSWTQSLKLLAFALATFPGHALRMPRTYAVAGLVALGPLGILATRGMRALSRHPDLRSREERPDTSPEFLEVRAPAGMRRLQ